MSHVLTDRGGWVDKLRTQLGLDPGAGIEWHRWAVGTPETPPPPTDPRVTVQLLGADASAKLTATVTLGTTTQTLTHLGIYGGGGATSPAGPELELGTGQLSDVTVTITETWSGGTATYSYPTAARFRRIDVSGTTGSGYYTGHQFSIDDTGAGNAAQVDGDFNDLQLVVRAYDTTPPPGAQGSYQQAMLDLTPGLLLALDESAGSWAYDSGPGNRGSATHYRNVQPGQPPLQADGVGGSVYYGGEQAHTHLATGAWADQVPFSTVLRIRPGKVAGTKPVIAAHWRESTGRWILWQRPADNHLMVELGGGGGDWDTGAVVTEGTVYSVALTYDGTTLRCYLDGALAAARAAALPTASSWYLRLGGAPGGTPGTPQPGYHWNGYLDAFGYWPTRVLTAAELAALHTKAGTLPASPETSLAVSGTGLSATGTSPAGEDITKLVDGSAATKWLTQAKTSTVTLQLAGGAATVTHYRITSGNDSPGRDPRSWTLEGSNDGSTWVMLDQQANVDTWQQRQQPRAFAVATPGSYSRYRWAITANNGDTLLQVAELTLWHADIPEPTPATTPDPEPTPTVYGWVLDPDRTAALSAYTTSYGRQAITEATGPLLATVRLVPQLLAGRLPTVGERFRLTVEPTLAAALGIATDDRPRFTGEVTDADVDPEGYLQVVGVGLRARALSAPVGADHYPTEDAGARVARVLAEVTEQVPAPFGTGTVDPSTQQLLRRPAGRTPAAAVLEQAQTDTNGQLVEQRTGVLEWHGPDHRRGATSKATLSGAVELLRPFRWVQGIGDVVNDAVVGYGNGRTVRVTDETSADLATGLGLRTVELATELADPGSAYALGTDLVGRRAWPTWRLPEVTVELLRSARAKLVAALGLRHGDLVTLEALPAGGPYTSTPRGAFVEGVTETADRTSWALTLSVSDPALSGVAIRWVDVPTAETWDSTNPTMTWLGAATALPTDL